LKNHRRLLFFYAILLFLVCEKLSLILDRTYHFFNLITTFFVKRGGLAVGEFAWLEGGLIGGEPCPAS